MSVSVITGGEEEAGRAKRTPARLRKAAGKLQSVLTPGESVQDEAIQLRLRALLHRRAMLATTDRRILFFKRGLFGGFDMVDLQWQDVKNVHVKEHFFPALFGADLAVESTAGVRMRLRGLESAKARKIYSFAQGQEQAWREKNRIREIEELRAKSGGITLGSGGQGLAGAPAVSADDVMKKLREAKELLDSGAVSDAEYETIKARLLNGM